MARASETAAEMLLGARIAVDDSYGNSADHPALVAALVQALATELVAAELAGLRAEIGVGAIPGALERIADAMP